MSGSYGLFSLLVSCVELLFDVVAAAAAVVVVVVVDVAVLHYLCMAVP